MCGLSTSGLIVSRPIEWIVTAEEGCGEGYWAECEGGKVWIKGDSPLGARYGELQVRLALQEGQIGERLGRQEPRYSIRALWCETPPREAEPLLQYGFNTVVAGRQQLSHLCREGIRVWRLIIEEMVEEESDGFIVTGTLPRAAEGKNRCERVIEEMVHWRERVPSHLPLIYRLNPKQDLLPWYASRLETLLDMAPAGVVVAFEGRGGIWERLCKSPDCSATPLLPILTPSEAAALVRKPSRHPVQGVLFRLREGESLSEIGSLLF